MVRVFLFFTIVFFGAAGGAPAQDELPDQTKRPHEALLDFFDQNERAIAYHKHCVSAKHMPPIQFLDNANYVTVELQQALKDAYPDKTREEIEQGLLDRAAYLQRKNSQEFYSYGCEERWGQAAKAHYDMMNRIDTEFVKAYIVNHVRK